MKIAVLCGHYPYSGAGVIARESARALAERHEVSFVHGGESDDDRPEARLRVLSLALPAKEARGARHLYWNGAMVRKLRSALRAISPDVVHFHILQRRSFSLASLLLSRRYRTFWTLHDQWPLCVRSVPEPPSCEGMKRFCLFCTAWPGFSIVNKVVKESVFAASKLEVVVPSRWLGNLIRYSLLGRKPVHLIYNGVDLERFRPADRDGSAETGRTEATLLFVAGPNDETKGIREMLKAFVAVRARHPALKLRLVGEPPSGAGEVPGVQVVGRVAREAMPEEYRRSDLFVLPTQADNTPVTLMEAMACGLPAVTTPVGGIPEMVEPDITGRLVPAGSVAALAAAVEGLVADPAARRRMGRAARARAQSLFCHRRMVSDLERVYQAEGDAAPGLEVPAAVSGGIR